MPEQLLEYLLLFPFFPDCSILCGDVIPGSPGCNWLVYGCSVQRRYEVSEEHW